MRLRALGLPSNNKMSNTTIADVVVGTNAVQLMLTFTNTNGGVKSVQLLQPGYQGTNRTFSNQFLAFLAPFTTLRFMDFLSTNNDPVQRWSQKTLPSSYSQAVPAGGAWEYVIELANLTGKDISGSIYRWALMIIMLLNWQRF